MCALAASPVFACGGRGSTDALSSQGAALFVQGVLAPQLISPGLQCVFSSDPTQPMLSSGVLDVAFRSEYDATLLIGNQPLAPDDADLPPADGVELQGAQVQVEGSSGDTVGTSNAVVSGFVYPAAGGVPGYATLTVPLIDANDVLSLNPAPVVGASVQLVAKVTVMGVTRGGVQVQSGEFQFSIEVCEACLVSFGPDDVNPGFPQPNCLGNPAVSPPAGPPPMPCVPGQDIPVDCMDCQSVPQCRGATAGDGGA
ncbi:MAG TPA: hypothetical protein VIJ22_13850 [Polyangiaceae bacterium]